MSEPRKAYPSDVSDEEWEFAAPYLTLMRQDAPQREHPLREGFNALRWLVRTGAQWRFLPNDFPPWYTVYQQARRIDQLEAMINKLGEHLRTLREAGQQNPTNERPPHY